jgi:hypothetical protein
MDLTFVPRVHNGVQMGLRGIDESLFPIIAPRLLGEVLGELQRPTAIYTDGSKTEDLVGIRIFLDDRDSYRFRFTPGHCSIFTAEMCAIHFPCDLIKSKQGAYIILTDSLASIGGLKSTGISLFTSSCCSLQNRSISIDHDVVTTITHQSGIQNITAIGAMLLLGTRR